MRLLIVTLFSVSWLFGGYVMPFKSGWQLLGASRQITDMSVFDRDEVQIIWSYDAASQSWQGYSPNPNLKKQMEAKGVELLTSLDAHQGFWINSKRMWSLSVSDSEESSGELQLLQGWNLVSLPVNMSVSPDLFGDVTLWSYGSEQWNLLNSPVVDKNVSEARSISNLNGFWLKSESNRTIDLPAKASELRTFASGEEMKAYIRKMWFDYYRPNYGYIMYPSIDIDVAVGGDSGPSAGIGSTANAAESVNEVSGVTTTNLQEADVDEHDVVKNDTEKLFYLDIEDQVVYATTFVRLLGGDVTPEANIALPGKQTPYYMYLYRDRLAVICYDRDKVMESIIDIYDVSDLASITKLNSVTIEGSFYEKTRRIGNRLFLINTFSPKITIEYPKLDATLDFKVCEDAYYAGKAAPEECYFLHRDRANDTYFRYDYDHPFISEESLVPTYYSETNSTVRDLVRPEKFYAPYKYDQYPQLTTVAVLDLESTEVIDSIAYLGSVRQEYASSNALYLVSTAYPSFNGFNSFYNRGMIYKFNYGSSLEYAGRGSVGGRPLNQFSMSEYNATLRIATTGWFGNKGWVNTLYTFREDNGSLKQVGKVTGLGKPGEEIRSVRFVADKGFVVTFRNTDPFYTLDLSDPTDPQKVGELEIPGYSEYMHPVDADRVLAIGRDADENGTVAGLQIQLFDISDFSQPLLADKLTIGDQKTYSEIEESHKPLAYRSSDNLFGFPYFLYEDGAYSTHRFGIYQVEDNNTITSLATQTMPLVDYGWGDRGIFFDYNGSRYSVFSGEGNLSIIDIDKGE